MIGLWGRVGVALALGLTLLAGVAQAESDADKIKRLERELADLKARVGIVAEMDGVPLAELKAVAGIIHPPKRGLTIDLSARTGEYCLRDPEGGRFMVHFSEHPENTPEDVLYFIAADSLTGAGLDVTRLPVLPPLGQMTPRRWYYYDGDSVEPHHKGRIGRPYLVLALDIR
ncbi:MAG: hypothetical protein ACE5FN_09585 [Leptospirillia bacterium]